MGRAGYRVGKVQRGHNVLSPNGRVICRAGSYGSAQKVATAMNQDSECRAACEMLVQHADQQTGTEEWWQDALAAARAAIGGKQE